MFLKRLPVSCTENRMKVARVGEKLVEATILTQAKNDGGTKQGTDDCSGVKGGN